MPFKTGLRKRRGFTLVELLVVMTDPSGSSDGKKVAAYNLAQIQNPSRFVIMIETIGGSPFIRTPAEYNS